MSTCNPSTHEAESVDHRFEACVGHTMRPCPKGRGELEKKKRKPRSAVYSVTENISGVGFEWWERMEWLPLLNALSLHLPLGTMRAMAAASLHSLRRMLPGGVDLFTHSLCIKSNDKLAL